MKGIALGVALSLFASGEALAQQKPPGQPGHKLGPPKPPAKPPAKKPPVKPPATAPHSTPLPLPVTEPVKKPTPPPGPKQDMPPEPIAILTRLTDPVAVLDAQAEAELPLFYWEKKHGLRAGDGLRQGVAAVSEVFFPADFATVRFFGETHVFLDASDPAGHRLEFVAIRRARFEVRATPLVLTLPGGTIITCASTVLNVEFDDRDHRYTIKNDGPSEVKLDGPVLPPNAAAVPAGNQVQIPLVLDPATAEADAATAGSRDAWAGRTLDIADGIQATRRTNELELDGTGVVRVGGARIVLNGTRVVISKPRG